MSRDPEEKIRNRVKCTKTGKELEDMLRPVIELADRNRKMGVAKMSKRNAKIVNSWFKKKIELSIMVLFLYLLPLISYVSSRWLTIGFRKVKLRKVRPPLKRKAPRGASLGTEIYPCCLTVI